MYTDHQQGCSLRLSMENCLFFPSLSPVVFRAASSLSANSTVSSSSPNLSRRRAFYWASERGGRGSSRVPVPLFLSSFFPLSIRRQGSHVLFLLLPSPLLPGQRPEFERQLDGSSAFVFLLFAPGAVVLVCFDRRAYRRNDKVVCLACVQFLAHLVNQRIAHELLALQLCALLLDQPTNDSVEVCVGFLTVRSRKRSIPRRRRPSRLFFFFFSMFFTLRLFGVGQLCEEHLDNTSPRTKYSFPSSYSSFRLLRSQPSTLLCFRGRSINVAIRGRALYRWMCGRSEKRGVCSRRGRGRNV